MRTNVVLILLLVVAGALAATGVGSRADDPAAYVAHGLEVPVVTAPAVCWAKTAGVSNTCWTCHTTPVLHNQRDDHDLQEAYAFAPRDRENPWRNVLADRSVAVSAISDAEAARWIAGDNYPTLRASLRSERPRHGFRGDLDFELGFDDEGFAHDGSGWRAIRYQPFPGVGWPAGGSSHDVFVRLPEPFRSHPDGQPCREVYRVNLAILEAVIASDPRREDGALDREVEPVDESVAGVDLDGDGRARGVVRVVRRLPPSYVGGASRVLVRRGLYPVGVEFLHTVRYVDVDASDLRARRVKEVRWSKKDHDLDPWARSRAAEREDDERREGSAVVPRGSPATGFSIPQGWRLQGWIEDAAGELRPQTRSEHGTCLGCHGGLGVTVDSTFALARKVPGYEGWAVQSLRGLKDVPQVGHADGEALVWLRRAGRGDALTTDDDLTRRLFPKGVLDEAAVRGAGLRGDSDLAALLAPPRERALRLAKAYLVLVRGQSFSAGRDALVAPAPEVHANIQEESTGLAAANRTHLDGRLHLDWAGR